MAQGIGVKATHAEAARQGFATAVTEFFIEPLIHNSVLHIFGYFQSDPFGRPGNSVDVPCSVIVDVEVVGIHLFHTASIKPFAGLVYCGNCNAPMFLSKAVKKNGREYVYYVCQKDDRRANATCPVHRVPAEHLEKVLLAQVGRLFRTPAVLARIYNEDFAGVLTAPQTEQALSSINTVWSQMFPLEQHKLIHTLISKVVVFEDKIQIHFEAATFAAVLTSTLQYTYF